MLIAHVSQTVAHVVTLSHHIGKMQEDISPDWWGFKYGFISGGFLGAESRRKFKNGNAQNSKERTVFHEDDQENLYKLVQVRIILI